MAASLSILIARLRAGRVRILWLVLGALLLVSALPIGLYHRQVLQLSQEKLVDTERVQQTDLTRVACPGNSALRSQPDATTHQRAPDSGPHRPDRKCRRSRRGAQSYAAAGKFRRGNRNTFIYLTAVGDDGKGTSASQGNFRAEQDPFVAKALQRAFVSCMQSRLQVLAAILWRWRRTTGRRSSWPCP